MSILLLLLVLPSVYCECYWNNQSPYRYFGSKTPYDDVRGDIRDVPPLEGCEPISIWFMMRHGTRHPGADDMEYMKNAILLKEEILKAFAEGRGELCAQDISDLKKWNWNHTLDTTPSKLTDEGYQELFELGTRLHEKYHTLLEQLEDYLFRPSSEQRTKLSAKAFTEDEVARPYKYCDKRTEEVLDGTQIQNEQDKYYRTKEFQEMLATVQKRIGLHQELTQQNVTGLYDLCRYYRAYSLTKRDPWCAVFSNSELEIMEYTEDVRHYYRNGYGGGPVNVKLGEVALKDLFQRFQSANSTKSITGYFTHDTMLEMVYSALGVFYDYPEISGYERVKSRQWRSSLNAPFAANIIFVLNRCNSTETDLLKVQLFINENELHLCKERACSWSDFNKKISHFAKSNLDFCFVGVKA